MTDEWKKQIRHRSNRLLFVSSLTRRERIYNPRSNVTDMPEENEYLTVLDYLYGFADAAGHVGLQ